MLAISILLLILNTHFDPTLNTLFASSSSLLHHGCADSFYSPHLRINGDDPVDVLNLSLPSVGPDSFAFDLSGGGPYTTVADGRILVYKGPNLGFINYAFTSPKWSEETCGGMMENGPTCGRPLGLGFHHLTGNLFVMDAFYGLLVVRPERKLATQLATAVDGLPFAFPDSLTIDQYTGTVYFTDASAAFGINQISEIISNDDSTGRLLKYDPQTKSVTTLLSGLAVPAGVALSSDGSFLLVSELMAARIIKFWLNSPKANNAEIILNLTGSPGKIKITESGYFWVAVTIPPPNFKVIGQKIDGFGNIIETVTFSPKFNTSLITEVQEHKGALYLGSLDSGHVGVYNLRSVK